MTGTVQPSLSSEQIAVWLRGLLTIAWADGHFDPEEQELISSLTQEELAPCVDLGEIEQVSAAELAKVLGNDATVGENFLRTAVMVALADGVYSPSEADKIHEFCEALGQNEHILDALRHTLWDGSEAGAQSESDSSAQVLKPPEGYDPSKPPGVDVLAPVRHWLDDLDIHDPRLARFLCKMIPPQCPFERDITLFGHKVVHIPPMCKLNPLYEQLVGLRFRSLSYLADECQEDVSKYC
ncbi:Mo-dependent nitrogenase C-terminal domain-containing protein [Oxynema aestuarii]|uniref:Nitrogenase n=1 Tax=Oxynema aestuarii AP17 TaxID=2064643 RepID=A0A6H1TUL6_9CYAN|nr:Mo-dependent nitrogenase C-terminal domain-containing protein [Oxynema aestuarii]QIZ69640.1 nitrogenase [Oxynema aestuarii AP17]